jgi:hypothetical protein
VNDVPETEPNHRAAVARDLAREFGFEPMEGERLAALVPRPIDAIERGKAFQTTYHEHRRLKLNRIGCYEFDPETRRRMTRDKENAGRRAIRAIKRNLRAALKKVKERVAIKNMATVGISSLRAVVTSIRLDSKTREIQQESLNPHQSDLKKRRPPPETMPKERRESEHIPFLERVELMQRHCGLSRAEAEAEAMKWEELWRPWR